MLCLHAHFSDVLSQYSQVPGVYIVIVSMALSFDEKPNTFVEDPIRCNCSISWKKVFAKIWDHTHTTIIGSLLDGTMRLAIRSFPLRSAHHRLNDSQHKWFSTRYFSSEVETSQDRKSIRSMVVLVSVTTIDWH